MIRILNLSKIYKQSFPLGNGKTGDVETKALDKISFNVEGGEFVAIMGPSGSGKSTLMHMIGALDTPTSGEYLLDNEKVSQLNDDQLADIRNRKIGFIFQAFNLLARRTALQNVMLPMIYAGLPKEERAARAKKYLEMVGLADRLNYFSNQLSGGQMQRVAIARALVMNPAILLADEPTGNIASHQADEIMSIFQELNSKGHTIVIITHEPDIAEHAKRIIHIRDGQIISDSAKHKQRRVRSGVHRDYN